MKIKAAGIPWERVEQYLTGDRNQVWLGVRLGASKAAVTNWKARGHIPYGYAPILAMEFGVSTDELLGNGPANSGNRGHNRALSETAERLIFCVMHLDGAGGQFADILAHHEALLTFARESLRVQHSSYELNAEEIKRLLQALAEDTGS